MRITIVSGARPNFMKIAPITRAIKAAQEAGKKIQISFCKVAAHTGNHYNEEADQLAKSALLRTDEEVKIV